MKDLKVIPGEACLTQHRLLVMDMCIKGDGKALKKTTSRKLKVWKLKDEEKRLEFERVCQRKNDTNNIDWEQLQSNILQAAKEVLGETRGRPRQVQRETWWWNCQVQSAIRSKRVAFRNWQRKRQMSLQTRM